MVNKLLTGKIIGSSSFAAVAVGLCVFTPQVALAQKAPSASKAESSDKDIIVTASRIQTAGFKAPTPTVTLGSEDFTNRAATTITDVLLELPQAVNGGVGVGVSNAGQSYLNLRGLNGLNSRNLLLVEGQRFVYTDQYGRTDFSIIPTALVKRVDVVTGGASAAWGSDALTGVVNIRLKDKIEGLEGNIQYGVSQRGDNKQLAGSLAYGSSFAKGRGQFMIAGEYSNLTDPPTYGSRSWSSQQTAFTTQTINGQRYQNVITNGLTLLRASTGGVFATTSNSPITATSRASSTVANGNPLYGFTVGANNVLVPYTASRDTTLLPAGTNFASANYGYQGDGAWVNNQVAMGGNIKKYNLYSRATYELSNTIKASVQASYAWSEIQVQQPPIVFPSGTASDALVVGTTNPYLAALSTASGNLFPNAAGVANSATLLQYLNSKGINSISLQRTAPDAGSYRTDIKTDVYRVSFQLDGKIFVDGKWSAYITNGRSNQRVSFLGNINQANLHYALGGCTGSTAAGGAFANADAGCVPINPFGAGSISTAAAAYIDGIGTNHIVNGQTAGGFSISDTPFHNWAGTVSFTAGAEARITSFYSITNMNILPSGLNLASVNAQLGTNLVSPPPFDYGVAVSGSNDNANPKTILPHSIKVWEAFGEVAFPLLKDAPLAKSLDFDGAIRYENNEVSGASTTWKLGGTWEPFDGLLFRVAKSKDSRDPNMTELYSGLGAALGSLVTLAQANASNAYDPSKPTQTPYSFPVLTVGNPQLKPETSYTLTYGVSISPTWMRQVRFSADVFDIDIRNEIAQPGTTTIVQGCFGEGSFAGNIQSAYCGSNYISRDPNTGLINTIYNAYSNIAHANLHGIDFAFNYHSPLSAIFKHAKGVVDFNLQATNLTNQVTQATSIAPIVNCVGIVADSGCSAAPSWRGDADLNYHDSRFSFNIDEKLVGALNITGNNAPNAITGVIPYYKNKIPAFLYTNIQIAYIIPVHGLKKLQIYGNVSNLFDTNPPIYPNGFASATPTPSLLTGNYDYVGRSFTAGIRFKF